MSNGSGVGELPRLDAFDHEFGRESVAVQRGQQRQTRRRLLVGLLLALAIVSVPALAWLSADGRVPSQVQSGPMSLQSATGQGSNEQVDRLLREVAALKQQVRELTEAHQRATEKITSLEAAENENRNSAALTYWYSDLNALNVGNVGQPRPGIVAPPARRAATARPEPREPRKRENGEPLSLTAPEPQ
jgi:hypothetical protein